MENEYSVANINKRIEAGKTHRKRFEASWAKSIKKYSGGILTTGRPEWQSVLSVPIANMMIEQMVADEMDMVYSKGVPIEIQPAATNWSVGNEGEFIEAAERVNRQIGYEMESVPERGRKWENFTRWKYLVGTGIAKVYSGGAPDFNNTFDDVNPYTFIIEPGAISRRNALWVAQELVMDKEWVRGNFKSGLFSEIEGFGDGYEQMLEEEEGTAPYSKEKQNEFGAVLEAEDTSQYKDKINVVEYWEDNRVVVVLNKKYKVRDEENPFRYVGQNGKVFSRKPYVAGVCNNTADEFWGGGFLENYVALLDSYDMAVNMQIDAAKLAMNPMRYVGRNAGMGGSYKTMPGATIDVRALGEIQEIDFSGARVAAAQIESNLKQYVESTSGQTSAWGGRTDPSNNDTAAGAMIMTERAGKRMQFYIKKGVDTLKEFGELWLYLDKKFMNTSKGSVYKQWDRTKGGGKYPYMASTSAQKMRVNMVTADDMAWDMEVTVKPIWMVANKLLTQQNNIQLLQNLKGAPEIDATVLYKNIIKAADFPEPEGIMLEGEEIVQHAVEQAKIAALTQAEVQKLQAAVTPPQALAQTLNQNAQTNIPAAGGVMGENQFTGAQQ